MCVQNKQFSSEKCECECKDKCPTGGCKNALKWNESSCSCGCPAGKQEAQGGCGGAQT